MAFTVQHHFSPRRGSGLPPPVLDLANDYLRTRKSEFAVEALALLAPRARAALPPLRDWQLRRRSAYTDGANNRRAAAESSTWSFLWRGTLHPCQRNRRQSACPRRSGQGNARQPASALNGARTGRSAMPIGSASLARTEAADAEAATASQREGRKPTSAVRVLGLAGWLARSETVGRSHRRGG